MHSDVMPPDIEKLWETFLSRQLDEKAAATLLEWLERHPPSIPQKRREAAISAALSYVLAKPTASMRLVKSVQARIDGAPAGKKSGRFTKNVMAQIEGKAGALPRRPRRHARVSQGSATSIGLAAALGLVLIGGLLFFSAKQTTHPIPPTKEEMVTVPVTSAERTATLIVQRGHVYIDGTQASGSIPVKPGSVIRTELSALGRLTLPDDSTFDLSESTSLTLVQPQGGARLMLSSGVINVQARPQPPGAQVQIETQHVTVKVVGTRFSVHAAKPQSWVGVSSGKVAVHRDGKQASVAAGEEIVADTRGLSPVRQSGALREITLNTVKVDAFTDPVRIQPLPDKKFNNMSLQRFSYSRPANQSLDFGGAVWPVALSPGEDRFELWIKPLRVVPIPKDFNLLKICLLINCGDTQYLIGECEVRPENQDWIRLEGSFDNAKINWTRPRQAIEPLNANTAREVALRVIMGEADFDHTPIRVYSSGKR